jgi:hypothetical protein
VIPNSIHVTCGLILGGHAEAPFDNLLWSETVSPPGMTTNVVPPKPGYLSGDVRFMLEIYAMTSVVVAVGPNPDPNGSPSVIVPSGTIYRLSAYPGDRLACAVLS